MKKDEQKEFGLQSQTGELCMLNKKERTLAIEILKLTLATSTGRKFLKERFGREGIQVAADLLKEMGVEVGKSAGQKPRAVS